jgi:hypothetical protein
MGSLRNELLQVRPDAATLLVGAEATGIVRAVERAAPERPSPRTVPAPTFLATAAKDPTLPIDDRYHPAVACLKAGDRTGDRAAYAGIAGANAGRRDAAGPGRRAGRGAGVHPRSGADDDRRSSLFLHARGALLLYHVVHAHETGWRMDREGRPGDRPVHPP